MQQNVMTIPLADSPAKILRSPVSAPWHDLSRSRRQSVHQTPRSLLRRLVKENPRVSNFQEAVQPGADTLPPLAILPSEEKQASEEGKRAPEHNSAEIRPLMRSVEDASLEMQRRRGSVCISMKGKIEDPCRPGDLTPRGCNTRTKLALPAKTLNRIRMIRSASASVSEMMKEEAKRKKEKPPVDTRKKWACLRGLVKGAKRIFRVTRELQLYGYPTSYADNALLADLMRASNKLARQRQRNKESQLGCLLMIHPDNKLKSVWSALLLVLLLYSVIINPLQLAFFDAESTGWGVAEYFVETLFFLDYDEEGKLVTSWRKVVVRYLLGWFAIDLISCFPLPQIISYSGINRYSAQDESYIEQGPATVFTVPRLYRLLKMLRLFKVFHSQGRNSVMRVFESAIHVNTILVRLLTYITMMCVFTHFFACIWCFTLKLEHAYTSWTYSDNLQNEAKSRQYLFALYWALATLTSIGFGDITARSDAERVVSIIWMLFGACFYTMLLGTMPTLLAAMDCRGHELAEKLIVVNNFCEQAHIDAGLKERMKSAIEYKVKNDFFSDFDAGTFLEGTSDSLRYQASLSPPQLLSSQP